MNIKTVPILTLVAILFLILPGGGPSSFKPESLYAQRPISTRQFTEIGPGVEHLQLSRGFTSENEATGPWLINLLRVDLKRARIEFVRALDAGVGLETTSSLAARYNALAAINGGYFRTTGRYRGESVGVYMLRGRLISETHNDRAAVGLIERDVGHIEVIFGHLSFLGEIRTRTAKHPVNGLNRPRATDELLIFTPEFHRTTLTTFEGVEVIVRRDRVVSIRDQRGSNQIPEDGYIVSATGTARDWVIKNLKSGTRLVLKLQVIAADHRQDQKWRLAHSIVGGGPQLVRGGTASITNKQERILPAFVNDRHPRTAMAILTSGKLLLVTVDGRQPGVSSGMSLDMLANLLMEFGAVEALNLDGGGSTTMVVQGKVVNKPSDPTGERPVSDAILVFLRSH